MNADFRKGKQIDNKDPQSFNLCSSVLIRVSSDKDYSVLLCGEIHSKPYSNEGYGYIFSVAEVSLNDIVTVARCRTLFFSERNVPFPDEQYCFTCTCFTAPHVHVVLSHMYMSYCFTCTSKTTLPTEASYVPLWDRALLIPEKETDGNDKHHFAQNRF